MEQGGSIVVVGSANMDFVLPVERQPQAGETITGGDLVLFPGGKGANQACAVGRLGHAVYMIAQVGADPFGAALIASLQQAGVNTDHVGIVGGPTGCACIYLLPGGENSIVISPGANATLDPGTAVSRLDAVGRASLLLSQLEIPLGTVEAALVRVKSQGATTILDPAPAQALPQSLLRLVDFLTPNQSEAATLLGNPSWLIRDFSDAEEAAAQLLTLGPSTVVMKLGALGCLVANGRMKTRIRGFQVAAVDSTAAGDAFNGALAVALAEGRPVHEAAAFANASAAICVTRHGAQTSLPGRDEVAQLLRPATAMA
jgi:ribokinase